MFKQVTITENSYSTFTSNHWSWDNSLIVLFYFVGYHWKFNITKF